MLPTVTDKQLARHHLLPQKSMRGVAIYLLTTEQLRHHLWMREKILTALMRREEAVLLSTAGRPMIVEASLDGWYLRVQDSTAKEIVEGVKVDGKTRREKDRDPA